jgi:hypothetical protein
MLADVTPNFCYIFIVMGYGQLEYEFTMEIFDQFKLYKAIFG